LCVCFVRVLVGRPPGRLVCHGAAPARRSVRKKGQGGALSPLFWFLFLVLLLDLFFAFSGARVLQKDGQSVLDNCVHRPGVLIVSASGLV